MNAVVSILAIFAGSKRMVSLSVGRRPQISVVYVADPYFTVFNQHNRGDAGVQKRRNVFQFCALAQPLFSFRHLIGGKQFAARYSTHVAKIANFVESFIVEDWSPFFHGMYPSMNMQYIYMNIGGQV
jgi:hypothetical protein